MTVADTSAGSDGVPTAEALARVLAQRLATAADNRTRLWWDR